eukprot:comp12185_c0_seq1/m.6945 comp12185_c0_seq1/g.6945  ORF comp12185_c0_seq1/g.6945 comp12185_c0_seq1/m.6945 type:complete len:158 (-) comp12185_c0_seq1:183-656(-)
MSFWRRSSSGAQYSSLGTVDTGNAADTDDGLFDNQREFSVYRALVQDARGRDNDGITEMSFRVEKIPQNKCELVFGDRGIEVLVDHGTVQCTYKYGQMCKINHKRGKDNFLAIVMKDGEVAAFCSPDTVKIKAVLVAMIERNTNLEFGNYKSSRMLQ